MIKQSDDAYFSWGNKPGSYLNTLNPISGLTGGGDRVPEWWMKMMPSSVSGKDNEYIAHTAFKAGACALLAAALVGGIRVASHFDKVHDLKEQDALSGAVSKGLDTSFTGDFNKKAASEATDDGKWKPTPTSLSWVNTLGVAVPVGATLLAASLAYRAADDWADSRRNKMLDDAISRKGDAIKSLIRTRGRIARGTATDNEIQAANRLVKDENLYIKEASLDKNAGFWSEIPRVGVQSYGLLASALLLASAIGGYEYFKATDENNIKYKAMEKGLKEYAKQKANTSTVNITPTDATSYFADLDKGAPKETDRTAREIDTDEMNKPISISL
jgi:hypothetical protein